eukprot:scaffold198080_cov35-Tisochrysis_lutea.AAC.2
MSADVVSQDFHSDKLSSNAAISSYSQPQIYVAPQHLASSDRSTITTSIIILTIVYVNFLTSKD